MKPTPLWPLTYRRAARWLDCHPSTISRYARGRKVTFAVFRELICLGVGKANGCWITRPSCAVWSSVHAEIWVYPCGAAVGWSPIQEIREAFYGVEGKQAPMNFVEIAEKFGVTKEEAEAAIRFPW